MTLQLKVCGNVSTKKPRKIQLMYYHRDWTWIIAKKMGMIFHIRISCS